MKIEASEEFCELFFVVIQLGAILAVPVLFWDRLWPFSSKKTVEERRGIVNLWGKVIVGSIPAAALGVLLDDLLDKYLYNYIVVSVTLIVYGIAFVFIEKSRAETDFRVKKAENLSYRDALKIGAFQSLSLIPGTSRSGSTILGGMLSGVSREASAEFSFFMAMPIMLGASGLKILKFILEGYTASINEISLLFIGIAVSFLVSVAVIGFLMDFVKRNKFTLFGYYRIALGTIVIVYFVIKNIIY